MYKKWRDEISEKDFGSFDFEGDGRVDKHNLDEELEKNSSLLMEYTELSSVAEGVMNSLKEELKLVEAEIDQRIRNSGVKTTEAAIKASVTIDEEYIGKNIEYLEAKRKYAVASSALRTIESRKFQVDTFFKMWLTSYFSSPSLDSKTVVGKKRKEDLINEVDKMGEDYLNDKYSKDKNKEEQE